MSTHAAGDDGGLYCHKWPAPPYGAFQADEVLLARISDLERRLDAAEGALKLRSTDDG